MECCHVHVFTYGHIEPLTFFSDLYRIFKFQNKFKHVFKTQKFLALVSLIIENLRKLREHKKHIIRTLDHGKSMETYVRNKIETANPIIKMLLDEKKEEEEKKRKKKNKGKGKGKNKEKNPTGY